MGIKSAVFVAVMGWLVAYLGSAGYSAARNALLAILAAAPLLLTVVPLAALRAKRSFGSTDGGAAAAIKGQLVVVCGASGGIGEQVAYAYARLGARVALVARREAELALVCTACVTKGAASAHAVVGDFGSEEGCRAALTQALAALNGGGGSSGADSGSKLDVLVLNHAVQRWGWLLPDAAALRLQDLGEPAPPWSREALDQAIAVNLESFVRLAVLAMPSLTRGADARGAAAVSRVVVLSSGAGKMPCPKQGIYAAAKHGLHGFFDSLRLEAEHKKLPVTFTACVLGLVETATAVGLTSGDVRLPMGQPKDAAAAILEAAHAGAEELYWPASQSLHLVAALRPLPGVRWVLDRLTLAMSGGNFGALLGTGWKPS